MGKSIKKINLFNNSSKKIERISYGNYIKYKMIELDNNSKFIVYFFFYIGAIELKEIKNHGVFAFSHQKDLIISKKTSNYIPELTNETDMNEANKNYEKNWNYIEWPPNIQLISEINQEINKCQNALEDLYKAYIKLII